ncbi:unnamed protein product [Tilletia controversa]|nr:unnamed protein product [Tilletia controversa]
MEFSMNHSTLPFASLSSSPPRHNTTSTSTSSAASRPRSTLPSLSTRAQDRLHQRRTALFKQPSIVARAGVAGGGVGFGSGSRSTPQQQQHRRRQPQHLSSSSSPPSSPSASSTRQMLPFSSPTPNTARHTSLLQPGTRIQEEEEDDLAALQLLTPSTLQIHAKIREQCELLRRQLRAERVERSRGVQAHRLNRGLVQLRAGGMQLDDDDVDVDVDVEAEWEREDEELIRRTMLLEHRKYMQAGLPPSSSNNNQPNSDWDLDPDDAAQLEQEIMFEQQQQQQQQQQQHAAGVGEHCDEDDEEREEREWEEAAALMMMQMEAEQRAPGTSKAGTQDDDDEMQIS